MSAKDDPNRQVPSTGELAAGLSSLRADSGLPASEQAATDAPYFSIHMPIDDMAARVAELLKSSDGRWGLFRRGDQLVTVNDDNGEFEEMKPLRFRTWFPRVRGVMPVSKWKVDEKTGERIPLKGQLTKDQAATILESILRDKVPLIGGVHQVKMPVEDPEIDGRGLLKWRLLSPGYDPSTKIYTLRRTKLAGDEVRFVLDYDTTMDVGEGIDLIWQLLRYFGWRSEQRDFPIHLAAMLTMFCRGLYEGRAPAFIYNANMVESGKSTLASLITWIIHGTMGTMPLLEDNDDKLNTILDSAALANEPYLLFDNIDWGGRTVQSALLDESITSRQRKIRKLGGNDLPTRPTNWMTIMTGNNMTLSPDQDRRGLIIDIVNRVSATERVLPPEAVKIDDRFFGDMEWRSKLLSALWSIVRDWDAAGRPKGTGRELGSFDDWSRVIPPMVVHAGRIFGAVWDVFAPSTNEEIGDKSTREYRRLAETALVEFGPDKDGRPRENFEITVQQFAGLARRHAFDPGKPHPLWPELDVDSVLQTEGQRGGWKHVEPKDDGLFEFDEHAPPRTDEEKQAEKETWERFKSADRLRQAAEWLNPKTRSSLGNALKGKFHEKHFKGPDGQYYLFFHVRGVVPARYTVSRVKQKR